MARTLLNANPGTAIQLQSDATPARISKSELETPITKIEDANSSFFRNRFGRSLSLDGIEMAIRMAEHGSMQRITDLSRETIDMNPHLGAVLQKRFGAVSSLPYEVSRAQGPNIDEDRARFYADIVRQHLGNLKGFRRLLKEMAWALYDGRSAHEIVWRPLNGQSDPKYGRVTMAIDEIDWIHPRRINFGSKRELRVSVGQFVSSGSFATSGISLDPADMKREGTWRKFIQWTPSNFGEYAEREGLSRRCLYYSFFKRYSDRERMILLELFGKPWRILEVPADATMNLEDLIKGDKVIDGLGNAYSARLPRGTKLDVVQPGKGAGDVHADISKDSNNEISKLVLGQIGTTDGVAAGMNSPQANVMQVEQHGILQGDANDLAEIIERDLTDAFIEVNFGWKWLTHAPRFKLRFDLPTDRLKEVQRLDATIKAGLPVALQEAYETSGFRVPAENEAVIQIDQPPTPPASPTAPAPRPVVVYPKGESPEAGEQQPPPPKASPDAGSAPPTPTVGSPAVEMFITVNEARAEHGLPPLALPDGTPNPDGDLIIAEFEEKVGKDEQPPPAESSVIEIENDTTLNRLLTVARADATMLANHNKICLASNEGSLAWDDTAFGSPEDLMRKGERQLWAASKKWADKFAAAVRGKERPVDVYNALTRAQEDMDLYLYSRPLERSMVQGAALGVLDIANDAGIIDDEGKRQDLKSNGEPIILKAFAESSFETAMKWFRSLALLPRAAFEKLSTDLKRKTFTIAGVQSRQMLAVAQDELSKHIAAGSSIKTFAPALTQRFEQAGMVASDIAGKGTLSASHVDVVYRTNTANTYGVGRKTMQTQPAVLRAFPVWEFSPVADSHTRETHLATRGKMLLASDPFWSTAYPPYGFRCRCRVTIRDQDYMDYVTSGSMILGLPDPGFTSGL